MAPERPRVLVVVDFADPATDEVGTVYHWDPLDATNELVVLWNVDGCPQDFQEAAEGVACVAAPRGYTQYHYPQRRDRWAPKNVLSWHGQVRGSALMLVAILPFRYAFGEPLRGTDPPSTATLLKGGRMAVYWVFVGDDATIKPAWTITPADATALEECCASISARGSDWPLPEPPLPTERDLAEWAEQLAAPIAGPPPQSPH